MRARQGLDVLGQNTTIVHHFNPELLTKILNFETADRNTAFIKELNAVPLMNEGVSPPSTSTTVVQKMRQGLTDLVEPFLGLASLSHQVLRCVVDAQRKYLKQGLLDDEDVADPDAPPDEDDSAGHAPAADVEPIAFFEPSDKYRRPSDYVAEMVRKFEAGKPHAVTGVLEPKPLKRDQAFVARFAHVCNAVWDDQSRLERGDLAETDRRTYQILLMGQGGSGKTAVVQDIVLFYFRP